MNIYLQNRDTKEYLDRKGEWTRKRENARAFETGHDALLLSCHAGLRNLQVLYVFEDERLNFTMVLSDSHHTLNSNPARYPLDTMADVTRKEPVKKPHTGNGAEEEDSSPRG